MAEATVTTKETSRPDGGSFTTRLLLVAGACVAVPLAIATITGSIGIPHNDDWAFLRILFTLDETGSIELVGWNEMMLLGHLALAWPLVKIFGQNVAAINVYVALLSGAGLVLLGYVARRFVTSFYALLIVLLVGIFPGFAMVTPTFMTDNTAFAAQVGCLLLGLMAFESKGTERDFFLATSLVTGLFAFSIREFSILAPIAVVAGYAVANRRDRRSIVPAVIAMVLLLACSYLLYRWRDGLPGDSPRFTRWNLNLGMLPFFAQTFFTFSFAVAPALIAALRQRARSMAALAPAAIAMVALAIFTIQHTGGSPTCCLRGNGSVFVGNLLTERGALSNQALFGDRSTLFPEAFWMLLMGGAVTAGVVLTAAGWRRLAEFRLGSVGKDPGATMLAVLGAATCAAIVFRHAVGGALFDRYVTMLIPVVAIFLLRGVPSPRSWRHLSGALAASSMLALVGIIAVGSSASFDSARWRAGEAAVASGIPAEDVDAGFEWVGFHYDGVAHEPVARRSAPTPPGYMDMFPAAGNCGLVAASPQDGDGFVLIKTIPYAHWIGDRRQFLWVYRYEDGCEAAAVTRGT